MEVPEKECIHQEIKDALGSFDENKKINPEWWTDNIKEMIIEKKMAYMTWLGTKDPEDRRNYDRIVIGKKNELWERICEELGRYLGGSRVRACSYWQ